MSKKTKPCGWQGYGFGARYEDAACCGGEIGDLDDCEVPGGQIGLRDERCPQCCGPGGASLERGPMALIRQRALDECLDLVGDVDDPDVRDELREKFVAWHDLVVELEEHVRIPRAIDKRTQ